MCNLKIKSGLGKVIISRRKAISHSEIEPGLAAWLWEHS